MKNFWYLPVLIGGVFGALSAATGPLPAPDTPEARRSLGLDADASTFALEDLARPRVVVLVFDLYCPACQKSARNMHALGEAVAREFPEVPMLAVGSGDTAFETKRFCGRFDLPFPCVSDREKSVALAWETRRTPAVLLLERPDPDRPLEVAYRHEGYLGREHVKAVIRALEKAAATDQP